MYCRIIEQSVIVQIEKKLKRAVKYHCPFVCNLVDNFIELDMIVGLFIFFIEISRKDEYHGI